MALHIYRFHTSYAISDLVFQVSRWITNNTPIWHAAVYLNHVCKPSFYLLLRIGVHQVDIFHGSLHLASWILGMMQSKFARLICTPANDRTLLAAIYSYLLYSLCPVLNCCSGTLQLCPKFTPSCIWTIPLSTFTGFVLHLLKATTTLRPCLDCLQISNFFTFSLSHQFLNICMEH